MKKINLLLVAAFITSSIFAQEQQGLTSKKGEPFLPETGEWAISINASPFLSYFGNFIGGNGLNAAPNFNYLTTNQTIIGKYFIDPETAYRAGVRLGFSSDGLTTKVPATGSATTQVDNKRTDTGSDIGLTVGKEWRKGKTRLQGFYGAEAGLNLSSTGSTYTYGNAMTSTTAARTTEDKSGTTFGIGVRGFIGAEYFVLPKMAIGGEFGWGVGLTSTGEGQRTTESWSGTAATTTTTKTGGNSSFGFDTDHINSIFGPSGTIRLTLHF
ncbi:MAG: hypothetical protein WCG93_11390 [Paludibacter sp.]